MAEFKSSLQLIIDSCLEGIKKAQKEIDYYKAKLAERQVKRGKK